MSKTVRMWGFSEDDGDLERWCKVSPLMLRLRIRNFSPTLLVYEYDNYHGT